MTSASFVPERRLEAPFSVAAQACTLQASPLEVTDLNVELCDSPPFTFEAIDVRLVSPSTSALVLTRVPRVVHAERPLEVMLTCVGLGAGNGAAASVARWLSAHALLEISVEVAGRSHVPLTFPVSARPSGGC